MNPATSRRLLALLGSCLTLTAALAFPAHAERGPTAGCQASAYASRADEVTGIAVASTPLIILATALSLPCPSTVYVHASVLAALNPGATEGAIVSGAVRATCTAGCAMGGTPIAPIPGSNTLAQRNSGTGFGIATSPLLAVFPDLPAGIYLIELTVDGGNSAVFQAQMHAFGHGVAEGAGRTTSP
jgi:alkylhydroperoxidase/carboxymuconolactone decarboxylase family protein YurZ